MQRFRTGRIIPLLTMVSAACAGGSAGPACPDVTIPEPAEAQQVLLDPADPRFAEVPPDTFHARFVTSKGDFVVQVVRAWAPLGAQRFHALVKHGFYDGTRFFRVLPGFVVQFGVSGAPAVQRAWDAAPLTDDPVVESNRRGTITFATAGPNTRTTQVFINFRDNANLDAQGFSPFGRVVEGMDVLDRLYSGYGEMAPMGTGPSPACFDRAGNGYFRAQFPQLDTIARATILPANQ